MICLSQLCCPEPAEMGDIEGRCIICGQETQAGFKPKMGGNFTRHYTLCGGEAICPHCHALMAEPRFRRASWVAMQEGVTFGKRSEIAPYLFDPPQPPFFIYISRAGQKQGWLPAMRLVAHSRNLYSIATDWLEAPIQVERLRAVTLRDLASDLREQKVTKTELKTGQYSMRTWRRAMEEGWRELLTQARSLAKDPLWEVIVDVVQ